MPRSNVLVRFNGQTRCLPFQVAEETEQLPPGFFHGFVETNLGVPKEQLRLVFNGLELTERSCISAEDALNSGFSTISVLFRLDGGKGGFGCLLRGQKGARKKVTNFDACRDLNGRRIRHARAVERLKSWLERKKQDNALVEALGGNQEPATSSETKPTEALTEKYLDQLESVSSSISCVVQRELQAVPKPVERVSTPSASSVNRTQRLLALNGGCLSDDEMGSEDEKP